MSNRRLPHLARRLVVLSALVAAVAAARAALFAYHDRTAPANWSTDGEGTPPGTSR